MQKRRSSCPISYGLDLFGDKWTLLVLRDILLFNRTRFSDFAKGERIATNILSDRLHRLERAGVIEKSRDPDLRNQNVYVATEKGKDLTHVITALMLWGIQYDPDTPVMQGYADLIADHRAELVAEIQHEVKRGTFSDYRRREMGVPRPQDDQLGERC